MISSSTPSVPTCTLPSMSFHAARAVALVPSKSKFGISDSAFEHAWADEMNETPTRARILVDWPSLGFGAKVKRAPSSSEGSAASGNPYLLVKFAVTGKVRTPTVLNLIEICSLFRYGITQPDAVLCRLSDGISIPFEINTGVNLVPAWAKRCLEGRATWQNKTENVSNSLNYQTCCTK